MFCPKCGAQVPDGSPFCASCGAPMAQQQQPQQPMNQGGFGQPMGRPGASGFSFNPAEWFNDFLAFFKKPSATIQQIIGWAGAVLLFFSTFLTNYSYMSLVKFNLWQSRTAFYCILLLIFILLALFFVTIKQHICVMGAGGLCFLFWIIDIATKSETKYGITISYSTGFGLWLFFLSSLAIIAAGVWGFIDSKKKG